MSERGGVSPGLFENGLTPKKQGGLMPNGTDFSFFVRNSCAICEEDWRGKSLQFSVFSKDRRPDFNHIVLLNTENRTRSRIGGSSAALGHHSL